MTGFSYSDVPAERFTRAPDYVGGKTGLLAVLSATNPADQTLGLDVDVTVRINAPENPQRHRG